MRAALHSVERNNSGQRRQIRKKIRKKGRRRSAVPTVLEGHQPWTQQQAGGDTTRQAGMLACCPARAQARLQLLGFLTAAILVHACCRLRDLPLYSLGVSSGSAFILKLPRFLQVNESPSPNPMLGIQCMAVQSSAIEAPSLPRLQSLLALALRLATGRTRLAPIQARCPRHAALPRRTAV